MEAKFFIKGPKKSNHDTNLTSQRMVTESRFITLLYSKRKVCVMIFESLASIKSVVTTLDTSTIFKTHNTGKYRGDIALMEHCHIISNRLYSCEQLLLLTKQRLQIYAITKLTEQSVRYINEKSLIWYINNYETHKTGNQTFDIAFIYEQWCRVLITNIAIYSKGEVCVMILKSLSSNHSVITTLNTITNYKTHNTGKYRGVIALMEHCHIISSKLCSYAQLLLQAKTPNLQSPNLPTRVFDILTKNHWPGISITMRSTKLVIRHS